MQGVTGRPVSASVLVERRTDAADCARPAPTPGCARLTRTARSTAARTRTPSCDAAASPRTCNGRRSGRAVAWATTSTPTLAARSMVASRASPSAERISAGIGEPSREITFVRRASRESLGAQPCRSGGSESLVVDSGTLCSKIRNASPRSTKRGGMRTMHRCMAMLQRFSRSESRSSGDV